MSERVTSDFRVRSRNMQTRSEIEANFIKVSDKANGQKSQRVTRMQTVSKGARA